MWILLVLPLIVWFIYIQVYKPRKYWEEKHVADIKPWPFVGNMGTILFRTKTMADWVKDIYNTSDSSKRYVGMHQINNMPTLVIRNLDLIKQVGIKDFEHFIDHNTFAQKDPFFSKNLFTLKGQIWRQMRSTLSPAFTGSKMRAMFVLMSECAEQFSNYFKENAKTTNPQIVELKDIFTRFANDVIASCAFGIHCDSMNEKENEFYLMGKDASNFGGIRGLKFLLFLVSPALANLLKIKIFSDEIANFFRRIVKNNIKMREEQGIYRPDLIQLLMEARKGKLKHEEKGKDEDAGFATVEESHVGKDVKQTKLELTDDDVTGQALLFFIAGFETISTVMCHMGYELALNEDVQIKLQQEVDAAFEECNGKMTYEVLVKMKYLDMVVSETLRKWPALGGVDRICTKAYTIPAERPDEIAIDLKIGDVIWFPIYGLHTDPQYFPNPNRFDPERFNDENKNQIKPMSYIPFGVGPRNCIASRFALLEAKVLFVHLLRKMKLEICEKSQVPLKISKKQFNMTAENGFWLGLRPRE